MIGQNMSLKFQVFNMGDISGNISINSDLAVQEDTKIVEIFDSEGMMSSVIKGAGIGLGAGIIVPGAGNLAGAIIGGIGGLITHLLSENTAQDTLKVYKIDLEPIQEEIFNSSNEVVGKVIKELQTELNNSKENYTNFVESQLNVFIQNLKEQLDGILNEYNKNRENIESHLANMNVIKKTIENHANEINNTIEPEVENVTN